MIKVKSHIFKKIEVRTHHVKDGKVGFGRSTTWQLNDEEYGCKGSLLRQNYSRMESIGDDTNVISFLNPYDNHAFYDQYFEAHMEIFNKEKFKTVNIKIMDNEPPSIEYDVEYKYEENSCTELEYPLMEVNQELYLTNEKAVCKIDKVIRTDNNEVIYYVDYICRIEDIGKKEAESEWHEKMEEYMQKVKYIFEHIELKSELENIKKENKSLKSRNDAYEKVQDKFKKSLLFRLFYNQ